MTDKHVELFKGAFVEQLGYTLACCVFAFVMLLLDGFLATSYTGLFAQGDKLLYFFKLCAHVVLLYNEYFIGVITCWGLRKAQSMCRKSTSGEGTRC